VVHPVPRRRQLFSFGVRRRACPSAGRVDEGLLAEVVHAGGVVVVVVAGLVLAYAGPRVIQARSRFWSFAFRDLSSPVRPRPNEDGSEAGIRRSDRPVRCLAR